VRAGNVVPLMIRRVAYDVSGQFCKHVDSIKGMMYISTLVFPMLSDSEGLFFLQTSVVTHAKPVVDSTYKGALSV
jgi:hypothetical protein